MVLRKPHFRPLHAQKSGKMQHCKPPTSSTETTIKSATTTFLKTAAATFLKKQVQQHFKKTAAVTLSHRNPKPWDFFPTAWDFSPTLWDFSPTAWDLTGIPVTQSGRMTTKTSVTPNALYY
jgi:hypothetical protein